MVLSLKKSSTPAPTMIKDGSEKLSKYEEIIITALVILAFLIRIYFSIYAPAWSDEISVIGVSLQNSFSDLMILNHWDVAHPPLLYIYSRAIHLLNGLEYFPIFFLRIPFALASSLAVIPIFFLGKKFLGKWGWAPALWYVINLYQVRAGYSMRPYGLLQLMVPIAWLMAYKLPTKSKIEARGINILLIVMFYLDYASIWFLIPMFAYLFLFKTRKTFFKILYQLLPLIVAVAIWIPIFIFKLKDAIHLESYLQTDLFILAKTQLGLISRSNNNLPFIILTILFIIAFLKIIFSKKPEPKMIILLVLIPIIISYLFSIFVSPIMASTNLVVPSIGLILLITYSFKYKKLNALFLFFLIWTNYSQLSKININEVPYLDTNIIGTYQLPKTVKRIEVFTNQCDVGTLHYEVLYHFFKNGFLFTDHPNKMSIDGRVIEFEIIDICKLQKIDIELDPDIHRLSLSKVGKKDFLLN